MFDINDVQKQAEAEIAKEAADKAKGKIKDHLKRIASAKAVVANLEREYQVLLAEIGSDGE